MNVEMENGNDPLKSVYYYKLYSDNNRGVNVIA